MASNDFENLLNDFQRLPDRPERLPTFMEITRYPHYEDVCSNILGFFFHPKKPHGLGTLFLDALARIGDIQDQETIASNVSVEREEHTNSGNRIDLLIQSDSHAILIENKIWASIGNPFDDYAKYLDSLPQAHKHKFLLTLEPSSEGADYGFRNISHEQLVKEIRGLLGDYVACADTRYLTLMLDFLNTLDNLRRGTVMDQDFLDFLSSRRNDIDAFLERIKRFKDDLRYKVGEIKGRIDVKAYGDDRVRQVLWRREGLFDILGHHIRLSSFNREVAVDAAIEPSGWTVWIKGRSDQDRTKLQKLLERLDIQVEEDEGSGHFVLMRCRDAENLDRIHREVERVVRKLVASDGAS